MQSRIVTLIFCGFLVTAFTAHGQSYSTDVWHRGNLFLFEGDTLSGEIKYNMENQSVQFTRDGSTVQAFSPRKILAFEIYDKIIQSYRIFYILPYKSQGTYEAPFIFELSYEGPYVSLLRTEKLELVVRSLPYMYSTYTNEEMVYTYYFLDRSGRINEFNGKKSDLNRIFRDHAAEIRRFVKDERLKLDRLDHLIKICSHYNSLVTK
ncbi:hypothetical protein [Fulvivirga sedimenti]|uniref:DUF4369 domain-containing protein n=1 Tax=Fulvivirga sedimenti TaxID=2879465 RepID=A0A9X1HQH0_9BACT|nr:hypothetical protein [Fulvivirga sedimenti]MCA6074877.1 hypothetical protein [Fulvivirga sedimenti]MCA6076054.1 hypothetical protein [Fulvivirga sedimenti]MCA6077182.1 hypothetical protein [Fulvivirga sedimenti]